MSEAEEAFAVIRAIRSVMDQTLASDKVQLERIMEVLDGTDIGAIGGRREATGGILLRGWRCSSCQSFNSSEKDELSRCRSCDAERKPL